MYGVSTDFLGGAKMDVLKATQCHPIVLEQLVEEAVTAATTFVVEPPQYKFLSDESAEENTNNDY